MGNQIKSMKFGYLFIALASAQSVFVQNYSQNEISPCQGDTRGDKRCNHDSTHRVCAKIGLEDSSFWKFTGQSNWCSTNGNYGGKNGSDQRCPPEEPTWCICKWATAKWIAGEGCNENV